MKKIIAFILTLALMLPLLVSCGGEQLSLAETETKTAETQAKTQAETEEEAEPTGPVPQSEYEKGITRILVLGNSGSNDIFFQLNRVFKAEGFGGKKYMLSFLYYSGCKFSQHVEFMKRNEPVYDYYKSTEAGGYTCQEQSTMKYALQDEQWDIIFLHPGAADDLTHKDLKQSFRKQLEELVNQYVPTEHSFGYLHRGTSPDDSRFFASDWWRQPPSGFHENVVKKYGTDEYFARYKIEMDLANANILTDPIYEYTINTGSGMAYAHKVMGVSQLSLYRDYIHLSDFGRVLSAYCFYVQLTGQPLEEVKLDKVPAKARQSHYIPDGDLILTDELKNVIKESANFSLQNPWTPEI